MNNVIAIDAATDDTPHADLSASGSPRWIGCGASRRLQAGLPNVSGDPANEGSAAHALLEVCLIRRWIVVDGVEIFCRPLPDECIGQLIYIDSTGGEWFVTKEMADYIQEVLDQVAEIVPLDDCMAEQRVDFSPWVPGGYGTSDIICIFKNTLYIFDLKYGRVFVPANHSQLKLYGLGSINDFEMLADFDTVSMHILQPKIHNYDCHVMPLNDLLAWGADVVRPAAALALTDDAPATPGDYCDWCLASPCAALDAVVEQTVTDTFAELDNWESPSKDFYHLTNKEFGEGLSRVSVVEIWLKAMLSRAFKDIENGLTFDSHKIVLSNPNRRYIDAQKAENFLRRKCKFPKKEVMQPEKLLTLTNAEKILNKEQKKEFQKFLEKPDGVPVLARSSDKRPALVYTNIEDIEDDEDW